MNDPQDLLDSMPRLLRELAEAFDIDTALRLADWRGGRFLYVPKTLDGQHPIAQKIGLEAARWLVEHYPGENLRIDRAAATLRHLRDRQILERNDAGESLNALAERFDLSQRQILQILKKFRPDPTPDLFGEKP